MKLESLSQCIDFNALDIHGEEFKLSDYRGKAVILSFFRNTSCPLCLKRVFELSVHQKKWREKGVEIIAIFSSSGKNGNRLRKKANTQYRIVIDSELVIYNKYGVEKSFAGFVKALAFKFPKAVKGLLKGGKIEKNANGTLLPADFLIDASGTITESWYGADASDNIPMDNLVKFVRRMGAENRNKKSK